MNLNGDGYNVAVGHNAGNDVTTGANNTLVGGQAGDAITTGSNNSIYGSGAGGSITTAPHNVAIGYAALHSATDQGYNVAIGSTALYSTVNGGKAVAVGYKALNAMNPSSDTDTFNVAIGYEAGKAVTTGIRNTFVGANSGDGSARCAMELRTQSSRTAPNFLGFSSGLGPLTKTGITKSSS